MTRLVHERCFNHAQREAVARCPECGRNFCRECVTEHKGRMLCAACLSVALTGHAVRRNIFGCLFRPALMLLGLVVVWTVFYCIGSGLLSIPASFHEGTFWQAP